MAPRWFRRPRVSCDCAPHFRCLHLGGFRAGRNEAGPGAAVASAAIDGSHPPPRINGIYGIYCIYGVDAVQAASRPRTGPTVPQSALVRGLGRCRQVTLRLNAFLRRTKRGPGLTTAAYRPPFRLVPETKAESTGPCGCVVHTRGETARSPFFLPSFLALDPVGSDGREHFAGILASPVP